MRLTGAARFQERKCISGPKPLFHGPITGGARFCKGNTQIPTSFLHQSHCCFLQGLAFRNGGPTWPAGGVQTGEDRWTRCVPLGSGSGLYSDRCSVWEVGTSLLLPCVAALRCDSVADFLLEEGPDGGLVCGRQPVCLLGCRSLGRGSSLKHTIFLMCHPVSHADRAAHRGNSLWPWPFSLSLFL